MHRNTIIAICAGFCAVAVIAGLFVANLSSNSRPIPVAQTTPGSADTAVALAASPTVETLTNTPPATAEPTPPPATAQEDPTTAATSAPTAAPAPTAEPTAAPAPTAAASGQFVEYTVQRGDELLKIAKQYNVSAKEIIANNTIPNPDSLVVGQVLRIPKK
jgi:LysM repeat protein